MQRLFAGAGCNISGVYERVTMSDSRRGKKQNSNKSYAARTEWMLGKKIGRRKQVWHWDFVELNPDDTIKGGIGHWEKI